MLGDNKFQSRFKLGARVWDKVSNRECEVIGVVFTEDKVRYALVPARRVRIVDSLDVVSMTQAPSK